MEIYKYGKIMHVTKNYLILDSNYSGWILYITRSERFKKDETRKIYIYKYENEYNKTTYGFESFKEKILFEDLISISGIGPKIALSLLEKDWESIMKTIAVGDWESLSRFSYVSSKNAKQIVFEFQEKYNNFFKNLNLNLEKRPKVDTKLMSELETTLKTLGFQKTQIEYAVNNVEYDKDIESIIENAIKLISNARELRT